MVIYIISTVIEKGELSARRLETYCAAAETYGVDDVMEVELEYVYANFPEFCDRIELQLNKLNAQVVHQLAMEELVDKSEKRE